MKKASPRDAKAAVASLGERVRARRFELAWGQMELAYRAGITQAKVSQIENARKRGGIYATTLRDIAIALDVSADWLLGLSDDPHPKGLKK